MKTPLPIALGTAAALALAGCTTPAGPVEVTRFVAAERTAELGKGPIFVETAPGADIDGLALAPYKAAVADELGRLGYREADRSEAGQIAQAAANLALTQGNVKLFPKCLNKDFLTKHIGGVNKLTFRNGNFIFFIQIYNIFF